MVRISMNLFKSFISPVVSVKSSPHTLNLIFFALAICCKVPNSTGAMRRYSMTYPCPTCPSCVGWGSSKCLLSTSQYVLLQCRYCQFEDELERVIVTGMNWGSNSFVYRPKSSKDGRFLGDLGFVCTTVVLVKRSTFTSISAWLEFAKQKEKARIVTSIILFLMLPSPVLNPLSHNSELDASCRVSSY